MATGLRLKTRGPAALAGDMRLPLVVGGVALVILLIATANVSNLLMLRVAASFLPARRAARADPRQALQAE